MTSHLDHSRRHGSQLKNKSLLFGDTMCILILESAIQPLEIPAILAGKLRIKTGDASMLCLVLN